MDLSSGMTVKTEGGPFLRQGQTKTAYPPDHLTDGLTVSGWGEGRWLAWCDGGGVEAGVPETRTSGLNKMGRTRADKPCRVTVDLGAKKRVGQTSFYTDGELICGHSIEVWTGSSDATLDTVAEDDDVSSVPGRNWQRVYQNTTPSTYAYPVLMPGATPPTRFVRFVFDMKGCGLTDSYYGTPPTPLNTISLDLLPSGLCGGKKGPYSCSALNIGLFDILSGYLLPRMVTQIFRICIFIFYLKAFCGCRKCSCSIMEKLS